MSRPNSLVLFARISKPQASLKVLGSWAKRPVPGAEVLSELITGASVGNVLDLSQPIDVAIALGGDAKSPNPQIAVSAAVRSLDEAKAAFSEHHKLQPGDNGAVRILGLGDPEDERPCDLVPSAGASATRLICGDGGAAIEALEPWLARSAPRETFPQDLHVEVRLLPLRPVVRSFRGMLPMILTGMLDARTGSAVVGQSIDALVGDVADLTSDMDQLTLDLSLSDAGADATFTATFSGATAVLSRLAVAHPERADVPPAAFWHLPGDADGAYYTRGIDAKELAHPRELGQSMLLAALDKQGLPEADGKALVSPVMRYLDLYTGPIVYAKGLDLPAIEKAKAAVDLAKDDAARTAAERVLLEQLAGWSVVQTGEPLAKVSQIAKDFAGAVARPSVVALRKKVGGAAGPGVKITPLPRTAQLPTDTVHLEVLAWEEQHESPPTPLKKVAQAPLKPSVLHVILLPDTGKSWIVLAASLDLAIAKARVVLPNAPEAGTLAKRGEIEMLRDSRASSGGYVSARGLVAPSPLRYVIGSTKLPQGALFSGLAATPAGGATAMTYALRAEPSGTGGVLRITGRAPRAAIEDVVKVVMKKW